MTDDTPESGLDLEVEEGVASVVIGSMVYQYHLDVETSCSWVYDDKVPVLTGRLSHTVAIFVSPVL